VVRLTCGFWLTFSPFHDTTQYNTIQHNTIEEKREEQEREREEDSIEERRIATDHSEKMANQSDSTGLDGVFYGYSMAILWLFYGYSMARVVRLVFVVERVSLNFILALFYGYSMAILWRFLEISRFFGYSMAILWLFYG